MKLKKLLVIAASSILLLSACSVVQKKSEEPVNVPKEAIKIGLITPLTGGIASVGEDLKNSLNLFIKENPIWGGSSVEVIAEDGKCNPTDAVNAANKLIYTDKVQVILIDECSGPYLAVAPIANQNKVLIMSSLSTSPDITKNSGAYGFRNAPSDALTTDVLIAYMNGKFSSIGILSENTDFAQAYRNNMKTKAAAQGIEVVFDEVFNPDTTDFKTVLTKLKESGAEGFVNVAQTSVGGGLITKQRVELGIDIPEFGTDVMTGAEYVEVAKNAAEGIMVAVTSADTSNPRVQAFLAKYTNEYGKAPAADAYAVLAWDKAAIIKNAIDAVGYDATAIKDWLNTMTPYNGLAGVTKFDENGDGSILPNLMVMKNGKLELAK